MAEKSALRLIPGRDALLAYNPQPYPAGTYVEYQTLIYKALVNTSSTFIGTEWELIGDLREVRVNYIQDRNSLTGTTVTSGNTGIHIPILDNTNVLVLNASADPQVGSNKFARYNYNKGSGKWLLLQISTGSTGSNVSDYNLLSNKPPIISGVTAIAGAGLVGGTVGSGSVPPTRVTFTYAHADTSSQPSLTPTGYTYIQGLKVDTFGHVTGATTSLWVHPDTSNQPSINNTGTTYIQNIGVDTDGHITSMSSGVWVHPDTSTQGDVINSGSTVIQSIFLDTDGHVIGINSATVSSGGGGVNFSVAGNSGGNKSMPNSGVLQITGGSNINTISTLHGSNVGVQLNVVPAGSNTYVQYNNNGVLGAVAGIAITGGTTLVATKVAVSSPVSGSTNDSIVTRNSVNGNLQTLNLTTFVRAIVAPPVNSIQFNKGTTGFGGNSSWIFDPAFTGVTLGSRSTGTIGQYSLAVGQVNVASGNSSFAGGVNSKAYNTGAFAYGSNAKASGLYSFAIGTNTQALSSQDYAEGGNTIASGGTSHAEGNATIAGGSNSHAQGTLTYAKGANSFAGGTGFNSSIPILALGLSSINISTNTNVQIAGNGANGIYSSIIGGTDNHIQSTVDRGGIFNGFQAKILGTASQSPTIIGGNSNQISGGTRNFIAGGSTNKITNFGGNNNVIVGGTLHTIRNNSSSLNNSSIFGGDTNSVLGANTTNLIVGGNSNVISGYTSGAAISYSGIFAGITNKVLFSAAQSTIIGGSTNLISGNSSNIITNSSIIAGLSNQILGANGNVVIVGGNLNKIKQTGSNNVIVGGINNTISGSTAAQKNVIVGGDTNTISGITNITGIYGGQSNAIYSNVTTSHIFGGTTNKITGNTNTSNIYGGNTNKIFGAGQYSVIAGGNLNVINGSVSIATIIGGQQQSIIAIGGTPQSPAIFGGSSNKIQGIGQNHTIVGGLGNIITTSGSTVRNSIFGGNQVTIKGGSQDSSILGGTGNFISGNTTVSSVQYSSILNGGSNQILNRVVNGVILGGGNNTLSGSTFSSPSAISILGGTFNKIIGNTTNSTIIGGSSNSITGSSLGTIIGSSSSKINSNVTNSVIIGGSSITLSGASQNNQAVVQNLMIWNTPSTGTVGVDKILGYNPLTKKVSLAGDIPNYSNIAFVSKSGTTGVLGSILSPYPTITAAMTALGAGTTLSKKLIRVLGSGFYNETITLNNAYVDIDLGTSELNSLTLPNTLTVVNIYGRGATIDTLTILTSTLGGSVNIDVFKVKSLSQGGTVPVIIKANIMGQMILGGNSTVNVDMLSGDTLIDTTGGYHVVNAKYINDAGFGINTVSNTNVIHINSEYAVMRKTQRLITDNNTFNIGSWHVDVKRYDHLNTGSTNAILIGQSQMFINISEFNCYASVPAISCNAVGIQQATFNGKIKMFNGNVSAISMTNTPIPGTPVLYLNGGTRLIPSGSANSITGAGTIVALGQIFGKNANGGGITIQLGTFTANSTYIV